MLTTVYYRNNSKKLIATFLFINTATLIAKATVSLMIEPTFLLMIKLKF